MTRLEALFPQIYFKSTGYSFTNLGRLFLRLLIGLLLAQFGVRQLVGSPLIELPFSFPYVAHDLSLWLIIVVELVCSFFIMIGLFTRAAIVPPFILMIASCRKMYVDYAAAGAIPSELLTLPFLFMGVYMFIMLVGPGKISIDYFFSLYLINRRNKGKEEDLEVV